MIAAVVRVYDLIGQRWTPRAERKRVLAEALTYAGYLALVLDQHKSTGIVRPVRVQVRKRGVVLCGRVLEASPGSQDTDWFKVDCHLGQLWFAHENVRLCSGDDRCMCEPAGEAGRACAPSAPAGAVPLGNTGTTAGARA